MRVGHFAAVLFIFGYGSQTQAQEADPTAMMTAFEAGGSRVAAIAYSLGHQRRLCADDEHLPLNPASLMKVLTSTAALTFMGPDAVFVTRYSTDDLSGGVARQLYVKGGGDPSIDDQRLENLAKNLLRAGVRRIAGDIVIDQSYFDGFEFDGRIPSRGWTYNFPVSAFAVNFNSFGGVPPAFGGKPEMVVRKTRRGRKVSRPTGKGPGSFKIAGGQQIFTQANGKIISAPAKGGLTQDPTFYAGAMLKWFLEREGIVVDGQITSGKAKGGLTLFEDQSASLAIVLQRMNKKSNNFMAETVLKALAAKVYGQPGSTAKGVQALRSFLEQIGVPKTDYKIVNGSGLSRQNRLSPHAILKTLVYAYRSPELQRDFLATLAIAGEDGTLKKRLRVPELVGNVYAKTGTLNDTIALSGFLTAHSGDKVVFAIITNRMAGDKGDFHKLEEDFLKAAYWAY
jgi:D-alanyl-D-alanine carboxypeptidase/D-alanyl-D-alanine-endopeptidase (penicillin-binding protein 4)